MIKIEISKTKAVPSLYQGKIIKQDNSETWIHGATFDEFIEIVKECLDKQ